MISNMINLNDDEINLCILAKYIFLYYLGFVNFLRVCTTCFNLQIMCR